jgi:hypothetical protein
MPGDGLTTLDAKPDAPPLLQFEQLAEKSHAPARNA